LKSIPDYAAALLTIEFSHCRWLKNSHVRERNGEIAVALALERIFAEIVARFVQGKLKNGAAAKNRKIGSEIADAEGVES